MFTFSRIYKACIAMLLMCATYATKAAELGSAGNITLGGVERYTTEEFRALSSDQPEHQLQQRRALLGMLVAGYTRRFIPEVLAQERADWAELIECYIKNIAQACFFEQAPDGRWHINYSWEQQLMKGMIARLVRKKDQFIGFQAISSLAYYPTIYTTEKFDAIAAAGPERFCKRVIKSVEAPDGIYRLASVCASFVNHVTRRSSYCTSGEVRSGEDPTVYHYYLFYLGDSRLPERAASEHRFFYHEQGLEAFLQEREAYLKKFALNTGALLSWFAAAAWVIGRRLARK